MTGTQNNTLHTMSFHHCLSQQNHHSANIGKSDIADSRIINFKPPDEWLGRWHPCTQSTAENVSM